MNWINTTSHQWFKDHDWQYGANWVEPKDYPQDMTPEPNEVGALIKFNGEVIHRIKTI